MVAETERKAARASADRPAPYTACGPACSGPGGEAGWPWRAGGLGHRLTAGSASVRARQKRECPLMKGWNTGWVPSALCHGSLDRSSRRFRFRSVSPVPSWEGNVGPFVEPTAPGRIQFTGVQYSLAEKDLSITDTEPGKIWTALAAALAPRRYYGSGSGSR